MPSSVAYKNMPVPNTDGVCSRDAAPGLYKLQLRRKLLQQQLSLVDGKYKRVANVVEKKRLAKLAQHTREATVIQEVENTKTAEKCTGGGSKNFANPRRKPGIDCAVGIGRANAIGIREGVSGDLPRGKARRQQDLPAPTPFKKGGRIDHNNKKHTLQNKQREMERHKALERRQRSTHPHPAGARDEVAIEPPAFPGRYLRGEVPCSRNCSAGEITMHGLCRDYTYCPLN